MGFFKSFRRVARAARRAAGIGALGERASDKVRLFFAVFLFRFLPERDLEVGLKHYGRVRLPHAREAFDQLHRVLAEGTQEVCRCECPAEGGAIVELGANVGVTTLYLARKYPSSKIFAFEANPLLFPYLEANTREHPNIRAFNRAAGAEDGEATFYVRGAAGLGSSVFERGMEAEPHRVAMLSLDSIVAMAGPVDVLYFDIEGAEFGMLAAARSLSEVKHFCGEFHADICGHSVEELRALLQKQGRELTAAPLRKKDRYFIAG